MSTPEIVRDFFKAQQQRNLLKQADPMNNVMGRQTGGQDRQMMEVIL